MNTSRRGFLGMLGALLGAPSAALALPVSRDPEELIWQPGAKLISIPGQIVRPKAPELIAPSQAIEVVQEIPKDFEFGGLPFKYRLNGGERESVLTFGLSRDQILSLSGLEMHDQLTRGRR